MNEDNFASSAFAGLLLQLGINSWKYEPFRYLLGLLEWGIIELQDLHLKRKNGNIHAPK
jgi:hypothetical protein